LAQQTDVVKVLSKLNISRGQRKAWCSWYNVPKPNMWLQHPKLYGIKYPYYI